MVIEVKEMMMNSIKVQVVQMFGEIGGFGGVTFKCRWSSKDVMVEMILPYQGEKAYSHLPYVVPTKFGDGQGCIDWQHAAWKLVRKILDENKWKEHHREIYEKHLKESRRMREEILGEIDELKDSLAEARRVRIGGWGGALLYGSKVKQLKKEIREWEALAIEEEEWWWLPRIMKTTRRIEI